MTGDNINLLTSEKLKSKVNIMNNENFTIDTKHMARKQLLNVGRLIAKAGELDFPMDSSMTQVGYNTAYGNTYLWCEDMPYTIFISDFEFFFGVCYSDLS